MKVRCIVHGRARRKNQVISELEHLSTEDPDQNLDILITSQGGDARQWAATSADVDWVISCGGDGTNNEVINGLMEIPKSDRPGFSFVPIGSGNDFARNFDPRTIPSVIRGIHQNEPIFVDLLQITSNGQMQHALNMITCGIGAEIATTVNRRKFTLPAGINYYLGIVTWLVRYIPPVVSVETDQGSLRSPLFLASFGNGMYAGNGLGLNPQSPPDDGLIGVTTIGNVGVIDFIRYQNTLKRAQRVNDPRLDYHTSKKAEVHVLEGVLAIETDGEPLYRLHPGESLSVEVIPQEIKMI